MFDVKDILARLSKREAVTRDEFGVCLRDLADSYNSFAEHPIATIQLNEGSGPPSVYLIEIGDGYVRRNPPKLVLATEVFEKPTRSVGE